MAISMQKQMGRSTSRWTGLLEPLRYRWRWPIVMTLMVFALLGDLSAIAADLTHRCSDNQQTQSELSSLTFDQEYATIPFNSSEVREFHERADSSSFAKLYLWLTSFKLSVSAPSSSTNDFLSTSASSHNILHVLLCYAPRPPPSV